MPYDDLEKKFHSLPAQSFAEVSDFFDYILYKFDVKPPETKEKPFERKIGGYEEGFYMAPDFDETPECFEEYM